MKLRERLTATGNTYTSIAKAMKLSPQAVSLWEKEGVPPKRVLTLSRLTGIPTYELRPDLFPKEN